ncbi:MAG: hypothetical protein HRT37_00670 [Alteromonadaceae bacterium]|nr:hypothetical protein [Alteromonadaceae bacterium]
MKFDRTKIAEFQEQDCRLTLREALAEFYSVNAHLFSVPEPKTKWTELLVHHDVGHVFFGVNTSILDEAAGDYWTLFGTDMSFKDYLAYTNTPEAKKLIKEIGFINIIKSIFLGLPLLYRIYIQSKKMTRKWEVKGYEQYMDMPLAEVRNMFNLQILTYTQRP